MSRPELNETLTALVGAVPTDGATTMVEVDLDVPMEISLSHRDGHLVVHAAPGSTRFVSGFLPVVHNTRLVIVTSDEPSPDQPWAAGWSL
ncbi:hypothetical protein [Nocardioides sp. URHA0020]|uniref:hypothetical protein n=1 Tax=Nocardioides sp. URHA0020 TaxID=1380392 RepID=UPI000490B6F8|nr:hypothetical protein [Nocardioides sp. URHA0020]